MYKEPMKTIATLALGLCVAAGAWAQDSFRDQRRPVAQPPPSTGQAPTTAPVPNAQGPQQAPAAGAGANPGYGAFPGGQGPNFGQATGIENRDFGVAASPALHPGPLHGPTPTTIPGGHTISTEALYRMLQGPAGGYLLLDVLGGPEVLPNAVAAAPAAAPGSFDDETQRQFGQFLAQATGGNRGLPLVLYCQSTQCWMSYNAALRAIRLGYTQVHWYRGGIEAWQAAGLPTRPAY